MKPNDNFDSEYREEDDIRFKEYFELNDNERKSLIATNYWRVINGKHFIDVPPSDKRFWQYFDKRCYDVYEKRKKMIELYGEVPFSSKILSEENKNDKKEDIKIEPKKEVKSTIDLKNNKKTKKQDNNNNNQLLF